MEITHDAWLAWLGVVNLAYQTARLLYGVSTIFRKDKNGVFIYQLNITSPWVYLAFITSNLIQITWLFAWDREVFIAALLLYVLLSITLSIALALSVIYLNKNEEKLRNMNMTTEILIIQNLVQASLILYASVVIIFTLVNLSIVLTYRGVVTVMWSSTISLIFLSSLVIMWFVVDIFIIRKSIFPFVTLFPYTVALVTIAGAMSENFDLEKTAGNSIFMLIILVLTFLFTIIKLIVIFLPKCQKLK